MSLADLRIPRQKALIGAGLGLVAAVLAACTSYGKKPEASGDTTATTKPPPTTGGTAPELNNVIAKTADVPVGSGVIVDKIVVTQPSAGEFKGFSAICTHGAARWTRWPTGPSTAHATAASSISTGRWPMALRRSRLNQPP